MTLLGSGTYLTVNGLTFHVVVQGKPDAPAVLLLHGFPDSAELWRNQVPYLVDAGYRVIVPDLRGFGRSDKPTKTTDYELPVLASDVLGILVALGVGRFHMVGHDFGAVLAWLLASMMSLRTTMSQTDALAHMHPAMATILHAATVQPELLSLTAMSVGHPRSYKHVGLDQREKSWYILFFQFERAEGALAAHDYQLLRAWSGGSTAAGHPEAARWVEHFQTGPGNLRAALNWYRANTH